MLAGLVLAVVTSWIVVDVVHGNWSRVVVGVVIGVVVIAVMRTVARLPNDPGA